MRKVPYFSIATIVSWMMVSFIGLSLTEAANITPQEKKLIRAAKKEGGVALINPLFSDRTSKIMGPAFIKRYGLGSGFKFRNIRKGTGATVAQVRQEIKANKFTVDVHLVSAPGFFYAAQKRGAYLKLDSGQWKDLVEVVEGANQYHNYPYVVTPLAYTFQPIWNSSCPGMANFKVDSIYDMVNPKLTGKTIAADITKSFTTTNTMIGLMEAGVDMPDVWAKLKATKPVVMFRTEPRIQTVINCERPLDMFNITGRIYQNVLKKPSLAKVLKLGHYKEGQVMLGNQMVVLKGSPHPNAGKLLTEFLMSKEGTDVYVEGEAVYSFRKNYTPPANARPYLLDLSKVKLLGLKDWVGAQKKFKKIRGEWTKVFK